MSAPPPRTAEVRIEVPFHDLDPAGYVWHGNYAKYLELARCALLKTFDYNYDAMVRSGLHLAGGGYADPLRTSAAIR